MALTMTNSTRFTFHDAMTMALTVIYPHIDLLRFGFLSGGHARESDRNDNSCKRSKAVARGSVACRR